jgi:hypothetical protein
LALKGDDPRLVVIGELKLTFNLELVLQGVDRAAAGDEIWLAARLSPRGNGRESDARFRNLCRRLGFGLRGVLANGEVEAPGRADAAQNSRKPSRAAGACTFAPNFLAATMVATADNGCYIPLSDRQSAHATWESPTMKWRVSVLLSAALVCAFVASGFGTPTGNPGYSGVNNILFLSKDNNLPGGVVITYSDCAAMLVDVVGFGTSSQEYLACQAFYAGGGTGTVSIWRLSNGDNRARVYGGPLTLPCSSYADLTDGLHYTMNNQYYHTGTLDLSGVRDCAKLASHLQAAVDQASTLPVVGAMDDTSTITPQYACYMGEIDQWVLTVTQITPNVSPCTSASAVIQPGGMTVCPDFPVRCKVVGQLDGPNGCEPVGTSGCPAGGVGDYVIYYATGHPQSVPLSAMHEGWGLLTTGNVTSGTVVGPSRITSADPNLDTELAVVSNLSGSGSGSTWVVNKPQTEVGFALTLTGVLNLYTNNAPNGGVNTIWIESNNIETLEPDTSFTGYPASTSAAALGLTQAVGAKRGFASPLETADSLNAALSQDPSFMAIQWIGDYPPALIEGQTTAWAAANSIEYLPPWLVQ